MAGKQRKVNKPKLERWQIRLTVADRKFLDNLCKVSGVDPSQFTTLLFRKYGEALAEMLSRKESPEEPRKDVSAESGSTQGW